MRSTEELTRAIREERRVALIVNDYSRHGETAFRRARQELAARGYDAAAVLAHSSEGLHQAVRQAVEQGFTLIIIGGGDGTISTVVDDFAYQDTVLGILPLGTGNSFARSVGIPLSVHGALEVITTGRVEAADLGRVGEDNYFANVANIGLSVVMTDHASRRLKRYLGKAAYLLVGLRELYRHHTFLFRLTLDDSRHHSGLTRQIILANGRSYGSLRLSREATINDGRFVVITMEETGRWQFLAGLLGLMLGFRHRTHRSTRIEYASDVLVETDPPQLIDIDGEKIGNTPVRVTVAPGALRLMVPSTYRHY